MKLIYLDTDMGLGTPRAELDDAAALITLYGSSLARLHCAGSTYGNVPLRDATTNLTRSVSLLNLHPKLGVGADHPISGDMDWFHDWQASYGATADWPVSEALPDALDMLIECLKSNPGQMSILAIGPLTNLALALRKSPGIVPLVNEIIAMGGSFESRNGSPEFNMRCDPEAADLVLSAGWPITLIGLEITRKARFTREEIHALREWNPLITLFKNQATGWIDRVESMGWERGGCSLHDAVAAAYLIAPTLFTISRRGVFVERDDPDSRGLTRFSKEEMPSSNIQVVTDMDAAAVHQLILNALNHEVIA